MSLCLLTPCSADPLPDPKLTPGVSTNLTKTQICAVKWGKDERHVSTAMKLKVYHAYGFTGPKDPRCPCEIDHYISRELGGADDINNLWPQPYKGKWNAYMKDRVETHLNRLMCAGVMSLDDARTAVKLWPDTYRTYFGAP